MSNAPSYLFQPVVFGSSSDDSCEATSLEHLIFRENDNNDGPEVQRANPIREWSLEMGDTIPSRTTRVISPPRIFSEAKDGRPTVSDQWTRLAWAPSPTATTRVHTSTTDAISAVDFNQYFDLNDMDECDDFSLSSEDATSLDLSIGLLDPASFWEESEQRMQSPAQVSLHSREQ